MDRQTVDEARRGQKERRLMGRVRVEWPGADRGGQVYRGRGGGRCWGRGGGLVGRRGRTVYEAPPVQAVYGVQVQVGWGCSRDSPTQVGTY